MKTKTKALFFTTPDAFRAWLEQHHAVEKELFVGFYKRDSGKPSITWPESVDCALSYGWIDGVRNSIDGISYQIRFTPRKLTSIWSAVNVKRVAELTRLGLMRPSGVKAFEARKGDKTGIYAYEQRKHARLAPAYEKQFRANKKAWEFFQGAATLVSADSLVPRDQRQTGRNAPETSEPAHQRFCRRPSHQRTRSNAQGPMTRRPLLVAALLTVVFAAPFSRAQSPIPNSPQGFQQQFYPAFESFQRHNERELQSRLDSFAIPPHWFNDTFGAEHGSELASQYSAEFAEFKRCIVGDFASIDSLRTHLQVDPSATTDVRTRRWTAAEDVTTMQRPPGMKGTLPPVQKFAIDVFATPGQYGRLTSWIKSYVYIDGAFRYFGGQNKAFWATKP